MFDDDIIAAVRERQEARARIARGVHLPVVEEPVEEPPACPSMSAVEPASVTAAADRFRCPKLHCTLTAGSCVKRQIRSVPRSYRFGKLTSLEAYEAAGAKVFVGCVNCATGRDIAARIGVVIPEAKR